MPYNNAGIETTTSQVIDDTTSIRPYDNKNIETATNQVVDDPSDVAVFMTGNVYIDHRDDIKKVAENRNCDMNIATRIWENNYFKGNITPEIEYQRNQWLKGMANISLRSKYTLADLF